MGGYCYSFKVTGGLCGFLDCWVYDWVYWGYSWGRAKWGGSRELMCVSFYQVVV